jgi:phage terminase large subunit
LPVLEDKKNHVIDALRYACEAVRRSGAAKPAPFKPIATMHKW